MLVAAWRVKIVWYPGATVGDSVFEGSLPSSVTWLGPWVLSDALEGL